MGGRSGTNLTVSTGDPPYPHRGADPITDFTVGGVTM